MAQRWMQLIVAALLVASVSGCGFEAMGPSERGVVFTAMPRFLGGGLRSKIIQPGEREFIFPWETLYRIETSIQSIAWGSVGQGENPNAEDYVETRALDGNEVGLGLTVLYRVTPDRVRDVIQYVGIDDKAIRDFVSAVARADIRTHMNILRTRDFFNPEDRQKAVDQVREALNRRLNVEGISIEKVIYNDHRFERRLSDGTVDRTYQEQIDRTQAVDQQTEQEKKRVRSVVEAKRREFNEAQAKVNRIIEEADGYKRQSTLRGDGYLASKKNEAEQISTAGMNEVEGLKKQIAALSGPGGEALLRLSIAKELIAANPNFIVVNPPESSGSGNGSGGSNRVGFDLNKLDINELLNQSGMMKQKAVAAAPAAITAVEAPKTE